MKVDYTQIDEVQKIKQNKIINVAPQIILRDFMYDMDMNLEETVIYAVIFGFYKGNRVFYGTREYLAKQARCCIKTARRAIRSLVEKGYIFENKLPAQGCLQRFEYTINLTYIPKKELVRKNSISQKELSELRPVAGQKRLFQ